MCFKRKPGLGRYNGSRAEWYCAYRNARVLQRDGREPNPATAGIEWKASLIVAFERNGSGDPLQGPVASRLTMNRLIDELLA